VTKLESARNGGKKKKKKTLRWYGNWVGRGNGTDIIGYLKQPGGVRKRNHKREGIPLGGK